MIDNTSLEIQVCGSCIVDSGFIEFGTLTAGDEPVACDVCGAECWSLNLAELVWTPPDDDELGEAPFETRRNLGV